MSVAINRVLLAGNLTRDPQLRQVGQSAVANFGLAVNRRFKGADGEPREEVTFIDIEAWGRTAELVGQYLTKGRAAFIEGRLKLDAWDDKDGQKRQKLKVVADGVQFLDGGQRDGGKPAATDAEPAQEKPTRATPGVSTSNHDEPPF
jgi:single-strand DNA-binding protein